MHQSAVLLTVRENRRRTPHSLGQDGTLKRDGAVGALDPPLASARPEQDGDDALVARYLNGDSEAFDRLVLRYQGPLLGYLANLLRDRAVAEELVQETFLRFLSRAARYRKKGRLRSYLFMVAGNLARDELRRRKAAESKKARLRDGRRDVEPRQTGGMEELERRERVLLLLEKLPLEQREAILLRYFSEMKFREIAKARGIPLGTALARCHGGLARLRKLARETSWGADA